MTLSDCEDCGKTCLQVPRLRAPSPNNRILFAKLGIFLCTENGGNRFLHYAGNDVPQDMTSAFQGGESSGFINIGNFLPS